MSDVRGTLEPWLKTVGADQQRAPFVAEELSLQCGPHESLQYRLPGNGPLVHEGYKETERFEPGDEETLFAVITDRQLLFAYATAAETTIKSIPHADITEVRITGRFLKKLLVVEVWERGTFRFRPANKDDLAEVTDYLDSVSDCWQIIEALFEDLSKTRATITTQIESGNIRDARETIEKAEKTVERIRSQLSTGGLESVLGPRLADAERTLHQGRMSAHLARAETLASDAKQLRTERAYTDAYTKYDRAGKHLDIALSLADSHGLDRPPAITDRRQTIENRIANLQVLPKALGQQAIERAKGTDHPDVAVEAWQDAFDQFRDALTAGWGTEFSFSGDRDELQSTVEMTVANLISARRTYAEEYLQEGKAALEDGNHTHGIRCYRKAHTQLGRAKQLAKEFRSGDPERLNAHLTRLSAEINRLESESA